MGKALLPELGHGDLPEGFSAQPWVSVHFGQSLQVIDLLPYQEACPVMIRSFVNILPAISWVCQVCCMMETLFSQACRVFVRTDGGRCAC